MKLITGKHVEYPRTFWLPNIRTTPHSVGIDWLKWGIALLMS